MSTKNTGDKGEQWTVDWLVENGFSIVKRNWRYSHYEIDIIAEKDGKTHFVEVKTRSSSDHSLPEEAVTKKKFQQIKRAANEYLALHPDILRAQFDIMAITIINQSKPEFFFIEDVYH